MPSHWTISMRRLGPVLRACCGCAALAYRELVQDRTYPERREDVRGNLQTELAPDRPGLRVDRRPEVDLAAHHHRDELVGLVFVPPGPSGGFTVVHTS